jgi:hypothetical protein
MTSQEVEEMLGRAESDFEDENDLYKRIEAKTGRPPPLDLGDIRHEPNEILTKEQMKGAKVWTGPKAIIGIRIDQEDRVRSKHFQRGRLAEPTFIDRIRNWLGW